MQVETGLKPTQVAMPADTNREGVNVTMGDSTRSTASAEPLLADKPVLSDTHEVIGRGSATESHTFTAPKEDDSSVAKLTTGLGGVRPRPTWLTFSLSDSRADPAAPCRWPSRPRSPASKSSRRRSPTASRPSAPRSSTWPTRSPALGLSTRRLSPSSTRRASPTPTRSRRCVPLSFSLSAPPRLLGPRHADPASFRSHADPLEHGPEGPGDGPARRQPGVRVGQARRRQRGAASSGDGQARREQCRPVGSAERPPVSRYRYPDSASRLFRARRLS